MGSDGTLMMDGVLDPSLLLQTLGRCLLIAAGGIAAIGIAYAAAIPLVGRAHRRFGSSADARQWLSSSEPAFLTEAWCRAAALAIAAVGVAAAAPWIHPFVAETVRRWDEAGAGQQPWRYGILALIVWVGLLPLALFVWTLPVRIPCRQRPNDRALADPRPIGGAGRLDEQRPHTEPVRRACRRFASHAALCAPGGFDDGPGPSRSRWSIEAVLVLPAVVALLLAATVNAWLVAAVIAALAAWCAAVYLVTYRSVVAAPGVLVADYLLLASTTPAERFDGDGRLAEAYLDPNPATLQDHAQLLAVLRSGARVGPVPWSPHPVGAAAAELTTRLWTNHRGRDAELVIAFHLRRQPDRAWRITRLVTDDGFAPRSAAPAPRFAVSSVWATR